MEVEGTVVDGVVAKEMTRVLEHFSVYFSTTKKYELQLLPWESLKSVAEESTTRVNNASVGGTSVSEEKETTCYVL